MLLNFEEWLTVLCNQQKNQITLLKIGDDEQTKIQLNLS